MIILDLSIGLSIGAVVGYIVRELIGDRLARDRALESISITEFNKAAADFRVCFVDIQYLLRQTNDIKDRMIPQIITDKILVEQEKAKILFEPFLTQAALVGFNKAWEDYVQCRINYGNEYQNPTRLQEKTYCLKHIDTLLSYAKPTK